MKKYLMLTNNPRVKDLLNEKADYELIFKDGNVQRVISECEEVFQRRQCCLAADPMAGRNARPFPYLTLVLEDGKAAKAWDWERIAAYSALNGRRAHLYANIGEKLLDDYAWLDCSLAMAALKLS